MNKNEGVPSSLLPVSGVKNFSRSKSLTPAVLGVASSNSHGVKLSLNMTSEDKKELLLKLEEWRKAKREKLAASILAKQRQIEKPKSLMLQSMSTKSKPVLRGEVENSKIPSRRESVFERLYKNNGKIKKPEPVRVSSSKSSHNTKKYVGLPARNSNDPINILVPERGKTKTFNQQIFKANFPLDAAATNEKIRKQGDENYYSKVPAKHNNEAKSTKSASYRIKHQIKLNETKPDQGKGPKSEVPAKASEIEKQTNPIRRSISMMFHKKRSIDFAMRRSISAKDLSEICSNKQVANIAHFQAFNTGDCGKLTKNGTTIKPVAFETPKSNKSFTSIHLRTKLESWLKGNGHPLEGYRHLRCFDITCNNKKAFPKTSAVPQSNAVKNSCYEKIMSGTPVDDSDKENVTPSNVIQQINVTDVENWLKELHRLIVDLKYPSERCEEWLTAIRNKFAGCIQLPIYWECLAAIHESKGDLKSAIEDYETAIIKGSEVDVVGDSLTQLFDKMVIEQKKSSKQKLEKGLDPKNIFKSTIIKFALHEKTLKKLNSKFEPTVQEHLYVATPVRRSTRIQTPFRSGEEVASLQTLTPEVLKNVTFQPNESLLRGD